MYKILNICDHHFKFLKFQKFKTSWVLGEGVRWQKKRVLGLCSRAARIWHRGSAFHTHIVLEAENPDCAAHSKIGKKKPSPTKSSLLKINKQTNKH